MGPKDSPTSTISNDSISRPLSETSEKEISTALQANNAEKQTPSPPPPYTAFTPSRQLFIVLIVTAAGFFSPLTGAVYLPSLILFENIFKTSSVVINASVSVYWAVFGIAPMFGATLSDYGGRKTIYVTSLAVFLVSNALLAAIPPTVGGLFTLRIFQVLKLTGERKAPIILQFRLTITPGTWLIDGHLDWSRNCSRCD